MAGPAAPDAPDAHGALGEDGRSWWFPRHVYAARGKSAAGDTRERYMQKEVQLLVGGTPVRITPAHLRGAIPAHTARILTHTGFVGGKELSGAPTEITEGKNIGRANATTPFGQAMKEAGAYSEKIMRKRVVGQAHRAVRAEGEHEMQPLVPAMLLEKNMAGADEIVYPAYIQPKLDGLRVTVCGFAEELRPALLRSNPPELVDRAAQHGIVPYSRNFKIYEVWHLAPALRRVFRRWPALYVDGELMVYEDGDPLSLQQISGIVRKGATARRAVLEVFDVFDYRGLREPFEERLRRFGPVGTAMGADAPGVTFVDTALVLTPDDATALHQLHLANGFEGSVFREIGSAYVPGYNNHRSRTTIKWKPVHRMELAVRGFHGGKGKAADLVRWELDVGNAKGSTLTLDPKWPDVLRRKMLRELRADPALFAAEYAGKMMTIEYQDLSEDGVPLRAKAVAFRDDI